MSILRMRPCWVGRPRRRNCEADRFETCGLENSPYGLQIVRCGSRKDRYEARRDRHRLGRIKKTWNGLRNFGLTRDAGQEGAEITDFGLLVVEENPLKITARYLSQFPEFSDVIRASPERVRSEHLSIQDAEMPRPAPQ